MADRYTVDVWVEQCHDEIVEAESQEDAARKAKELVEVEQMGADIKSVDVVSTGKTFNPADLD